MRYFKKFVLFIILFIISNLNSFSEEKKVVIYTAPSIWQESSPVSANDLVPALGDGEEKLVTEKMDDKTVSQLVDSFVTRAEKVYISKYTPPDGFIEWLKGNPKIRSTFWSAINPYYDNIPKAMEVLNELRKADAKAVERFCHLAVAFAVVWDNPDAIKSSRYSSIWKMTSSQFESLPNYLDNFKCFTNPEHLNLLNISPDKLTWPILVQIVDMDLSTEEVEWGFKNKSRGKNVYSLYDSIKYDYGKAGGETPKIGSNKYNLQNILKFGGICGDQAHFASRMSKLFGTPAMKVEGTGRYGEGHAWLGFMNMKGNKPELDFTGRYFFDYYYTGEIFDPQTRTKIIDSELAMLYEGINTDYNKYINSLILTRMAEGLISDKPEVSLKLATNALQQNMFYASAWLVLMKYAKNGTLNPTQGITWFNQMTTSLKKYPNIIMSSLVDFMTYIPKDDVQKRDANYQSIAQIFKTAKRPDLLIRLNLVWGEELCARGEESKAMSMYLDCAQSNAGEGNLVLPLLERADELSRKLNKNRETVVYYENIIKKIPHFRDNKISKSYQEAAQFLVCLYNDINMADKADKLTKMAQLGKAIQVASGIDDANKQKPEKAIAEFNEAIEKDSHVATTYNERGEAYRKKGEIEKALKDYDEAIRLNPKLDEVYTNRANLYSNIGDSEKAIEDYSEAIKLNPKNAVTYNNRGWVYYENEEYDKAIADYNEAMKLNPKYDKAYYNRGWAYYDKEEYDKAIADYTEAIKINPKYDMAYNNRGLAYWVKGELDKAMADCNEAIRLNKKNDCAYNNRALVNSDKGNYDKGITDSNEAIKVNPQNDMAYNNRGWAYYNKGELDKAMADYDKSINLNKKNYLSYNNRSLINIDKGEFDKAIIDCNETIKLNSKYANAYNNRGRAYAEKGKIEKALKDYNEAIRLDSKHACAYHNRGWLYYNLGEINKAINDYDESIKLGPTVVAYNNRGLANWRKREFDKAIDDYNKALKLDPKYDTAYFNRGLVYESKSDFNKAIEDYSEAIKLDPKNGWVYYLRGGVYYKKGELKKAINDWEYLLKIEPNHPKASEVREKIRQIKK